MNELENLNLKNPSIVQGNIYGAGISSSNIISSNLHSGVINNVTIYDSKFMLNGIDLEKKLNELETAINQQQKINNILINILLQKGILKNIEEYNDFSDAEKLIIYLAENK